MGAVSGNAGKRPLFLGDDDRDGGITVCRDVGTGRSIVIIECPATRLEGSMNQASLLSEGFSHSARVVYLVVQPPSGGAEWRLLSGHLEEQLARLGIRLCTMVGIGEGSVVAQHLAITRPKVCQALVLVDPVFQLSETFLGRCAARVESVLPLGLPLRIGSDQFASAPFLHRIRCPTLVLVSHEVGAAAARHMIGMARKIPNAWYQILRAEGGPADFIDLMRTFLLVRNRHPMRRAAS